MKAKSTVDEIRTRFDAEVERFSNLETGQAATMDAPLSLDLIAAAAAAASPHASRVLDIGCGAGNYTLKLLEDIPGANVTLIDLSRPMLDRAAERVGAAASGDVSTVQGDIRELDLEIAGFDIVLAAAVFHHLRDDDEWLEVFAKCHSALSPGGSIWISDLVSHEDAAVQELMWRRYGTYLETLGGADYRDEVFGYIEREDSPRPLTFQLDLLRRVGFARVDILHKHGCFAAFGAVR